MSSKKWTLSEDASKAIKGLVKKTYVNSRHLPTGLRIEHITALRYAREKRRSSAGNPTLSQEDVEALRDVLEPYTKARIAHFLKAAGGSLFLPCNKYCCTLFNRYVDPPFPDWLTLFDRDLHNPIHPIFCNSNFMGREHDYLPLHLASHLLQSPGMVVFLNTMVDGEVSYLHSCVEHTWEDVAEWDRLSHLQGNNGPPVQIMSRPEHKVVNAVTTKRAQDILDALTDMVRFEVTESNIDYPMDEDSGTCQPGWWPVSPRAALIFPRGRTSKITISGQNYDLLRGFIDTYQAGFTDFNEMQRVRRSVLLETMTMAGTILHELGHAINNAVAGIRDSEILYNGELRGEMGEQVEKVVFGGCMKSSHDCWLRLYPDAERRCFRRPNPDVLPMFPTLVEHPSRLSNSIYRFYSLRADNYDADPEYDMLWRVPLSSISDLLTDRFWENVAANPQPDAVFPPHVAALPFDLPFDIQTKDDLFLIPVDPKVNVPVGTEWCFDGLPLPKENPFKDLVYRIPPEEVDFSMEQFYPTSSAVPQDENGFLVLDYHQQQQQEQHQEEQHQQEQHQQEQHQHQQHQQQQPQSQPDEVIDRRLFKIFLQTNMGRSNHEGTSRVQKRPASRGNSDGGRGGSPSPTSSPITGQTSPQAKGRDKISASSPIAEPRSKKRRGDEGTDSSTPKQTEREKAASRKCKKNTLAAHDWSVSGEAEDVSSPEPTLGDQ